MFAIAVMNFHHINRICKMTFLRTGTVPKILDIFQGVSLCMHSIFISDLGSLISAMPFCFTENKVTLESLGRLAGLPRLAPVLLFFVILLFNR